MYLCLVQISNEFSVALQGQSLWSKFKFSYRIDSYKTQSQTRYCVFTSCTYTTPSGRKLATTMAWIPDLGTWPLWNLGERDSSLPFQCTSTTDWSNISIDKQTYTACSKIKYRLLTNAFINKIVYTNCTKLSKIRYINKWKLWVAGYTRSSFCISEQ